VREKDGDSQNHPIKEGQDGIAHAATLPLNRKAKSEKIKKSMFQNVFRPRRHSQRRSTRVGNTVIQENRLVAGLPLVGTATDSDVRDIRENQNLPLKENQNTRPIRWASRWSATGVQKLTERTAAASPRISADFMIILRLKNAHAR
jgi:hypothetical protein